MNILIRGNLPVFFAILNFIVLSLHVGTRRYFKHVFLT